MKASNGVEFNDGAAYYQGQRIGEYHRVNKNYPPTVTTPGGKSIGCTNDEDAATAILAAWKMEQLGANIDGNIFPDEQRILRINDILLSSGFDPKEPVKIIAKVHFNHFRSTGSSPASKPVKFIVMEIDLDEGTFTGTDRGKKKEFRFANQDEMIRKLQDHIEAKLTS